MRARRDLAGLCWPEATLFVVLHAAFVAADTWLTVLMLVLGLGVVRSLNVVVICLILHGVRGGGRCDADAVKGGVTFVAVFRWARLLIEVGMLLRGVYRAVRPLVASLEERALAGVKLPPWAVATLTLLDDTRRLLQIVLFWLGVVALVGIALTD